MEEALVKSRAELKITLMARSLANKESRKILTEPSEITALMRSSTQYLIRRGSIKPTDNIRDLVKFLVVPTKDLISEAEQFEIVVDEEYQGWKKEYAWLEHFGTEPVMVMVYLVNAIHLLPDFKQSRLNRCAAFFAERKAFESACLTCINENRQ